eukprot:6202130-Pleurochrysis_carterae.AAC.1
MSLCLSLSSSVSSANGMRVSFCRALYRTVRFELLRLAVLMAKRGSSSISRDEDDKYVRLDDFQALHKALAPWQRELIARKWLKSTGKYFGNIQNVQNRWYLKFLSLCRQPAGRADGSRGSQQCFFEMDLPERCCLEPLGLPGDAFLLKYNSRYSVDAEGQIQWKYSKTVDTFFMADKHAVSDYLRFHEQQVSLNCAAYGSTKAVVARSDGIKVVTTIIPPLIVELCKRSFGRLVLAVTCNLLTYNDVDGLDFPPGFEYAAGERESFRKLVHNHLDGLANRNHRLSQRMLRLLPPAYRDGESEGEEAASSISEASASEAAPKKDEQ